MLNAALLGQQLSYGVNRRGSVDVRGVGVVDRAVGIHHAVVVRAGAVGLRGALQRIACTFGLLPGGDGCLPLRRSMRGVSRVLARGCSSRDRDTPQPGYETRTPQPSHWSTPRH